jgi:hypothetical protein
MIVGIGGMLSVVLFQLLLLAGALTFAQQVVPVTIAILLGAWVVTTGYLARSDARLPYSVGMSLLAVPYFGYPIWAFWLGRHLIRLAAARRRPAAQSSDA